MQHLKSLFALKGSEVFWFLEDDAYVWEYADGRRRWRSVDSDSSVKLELAYKEGAPSVDLCISATNFTADLDNSVMKSADGGIVHKVIVSRACHIILWRFAFYHVKQVICIEIAAFIILLEELFRLKISCLFFIFKDKSRYTLFLFVQD